MNPVPLFSAAEVLQSVDLVGAVTRVVNSGWYVLGSEVGAFEREFAHYCGVAHCVGVANGTEALELALRAVGVTAGDHVALAANAGFYGSTAVHAVGAIPRYADVDPDTLTLTPGTLRTIVEGGVKALVATHLYGRLADMSGICALASAHGVPVIEDCAQAHGASRDGKRAGSLGTVGCFSFYPTKNLGALGDGGAVTTSDEGIADNVRRLRQYGWTEKYRVTATGGRNSRLDEMQAAVLRAKLPFLDDWNAQRKAVARRYNEGFRRLPLTTPPITGDDYVAHLYVVRVAERERFRAALKERAVASDVHYPIADHMQPAYARTEPRDPLPVTEAACAQVVSLPCFPGITSEQVEQVIDAVKFALR